MKHKIIYFISLIFMVITLSGLFNRILIYRRINQEMEKRKKELSALTEKNKALVVQLKEVKSYPYQKELAEKILGTNFKIPKASEEGKIVLEPTPTEAVLSPTPVPHWQEWREIFGL
ncbi:MAG: hypothetical protein M1514_04215 [Patescibacteria group bacterium]|nr:hypothetical protein [Patescibacteria group bacterium]